MRFSPRGLLGVIFTSVWTPLALAQSIPTPLPGNPGNVFLRGEAVRIKLPERPSPHIWRLVDYDGKLSGTYTNATEAALARLPVGFYRFIGENTNDWVSLAILEPLHAPISPQSPIGIDGGIAWGYASNQISAAANLSRLAGVNWIRDRMSWPELQPTRDGPIVTNRYDAAVDAQASAGLRVLEVMHASPAWASSNTIRFPEDLRTAYQFFREAAGRWQGKVSAFEPWNEADVKTFGGHIGSEMASFQKAAFLGLKAGNPGIMVGQSPFALAGAGQLDDFAANDVGPYFDTFNFHHYVALSNYPALYQEFRQRAAGRPLWVTEFCRPLKWTGDEKLKELPDDRLVLQAELLVKGFAASLSEGTTAAFYFLLRDYSEGEIQFGILRADLTPRPAYSALAAVGRLLNNAHPLGGVTGPNPAVEAYLFRAEPDGRPAEVLVAWSRTNVATLDLPRMPRAIYDHLGRPLVIMQKVPLGPAPIFIELPAGTASRMALEAPPLALPAQQEKPSSIVLQAVWPRVEVKLDQSSYYMADFAKVSVPVYIYNFSAQTVRGKVVAAAVPGWKVALDETVVLQPMERKSVILNVEPPNVPRQLGTFTVRGDFGTGGKAILSLRIFKE